MYQHVTGFTPLILDLIIMHNNLGREHNNNETPLRGSDHAMVELEYMVIDEITKESERNTNTRAFA